LISKKGKVVSDLEKLRKDLKDLKRRGHFRNFLKQVLENMLREINF